MKNKVIFIVVVFLVVVLFSLFVIIKPLSEKKENMNSSNPPEENSNSQDNPQNGTELENNTPPEPEDETKISLSLNFNETNMPNGLDPMGEKITHDITTNPRGHEGIDFTWDKKAPIYAFSEGTVIAITNSDGHPEAPLWDIGVRTGKYLNSYTELEDYNRNLNVGDNISKGEFIGYPWHPKGTHAGYRMIHWNFGNFIEAGATETWNKIYPDRLCPLTYFDNKSLTEINQIWAKTKWPEMKADYPLICNGVFE